MSLGSRWTPGIGDPSLGGWLTVFAYAFAAILCFRTFLNLRPIRGTTVQRGLRERQGWLWLSALMAFLCVNKQLDLQSLFTEIGRDIARMQGWYGERRHVQALFILGFGSVSAIAGLVIMAAAKRAQNRWVRFAAFGTILLISFIVIRAASFHHFELISDATVAGLRFNWIFENVPIIMIMLAAHQSAALR